MKKLLLLCGMLWATVASAQFVPGQVLTAAELNSQFALYAPLAGATFTGPVNHTDLSASGTVGGVGFTNLLSPYLLSATAVTTYAPITGSANYATITNLALKAPIASPTFTGTVTIPSGASISGFAPLSSPTFTGSPVVPGYLTTATASATYAPLASPTFTGTVTAANLTATGTVSGAGFSNYLASPPAIGGIVSQTGAFTTLSSTGIFTPSQTLGIAGTTTNNSVNAGGVGELLSNSPSAVSMTSATATNCGALSLSAGDWDVYGGLVYTPAATTAVVALASGINQTSATLPAVPNVAILNATLTTGGQQVTVLPTVRELVGTTTTIYAIGYMSFSVSTATCTGYLFARRRR